MAARAIGSATISFGLIAIPVKLYPATRSSAQIHFHQMHEDCGQRLRQQLVCPKHGVVERDDIAKGYEFAKGQYVLFSPEELKALEERTTHAIEIAEFVPGAEIDRLFVDRAYYLGPDKGGARPYRLLSAALAKTGRSALGKYAARGKEYLVVIRPFAEGLVMDQLRYADEIRPFAEVPLEDGEVREGELDLAVQLVEQTANEHFEPEKYEDEVRKRVLELIERKIEGQDITVSAEEAPEGRIVDMMEALKASLAASGADVSRPKPARRAARPAKKKAKARARGK